MKLEKGASVKDIISFQVHRNIVNLYKKYFEISEDLLRDHKLLLSKIETRIESSGLELDMFGIEELDYFTEQRYDNIRKKILDAGNDSIREIEKALEFVDITLKKDE